MRKKHTHGSANTPQPYDLSNLFSIAVSCIKFSSLKTEEVYSTLSTISQGGTNAIQELHIYDSEGCSKKSVDFSKFDSGVTREIFDEMVSSALGKEQVRLSMLVRLKLPFVDFDAQVNFYHRQSVSCITIQVGQGPFLEGPEGPYKQNRLDVLKDLACSVFCNVHCIAGVISTEDNMLCTNIEELLDGPPVNWAYWSNEIMQGVPEELLVYAKKAALEVDNLQDCGVFWKWSNFGEHPDQSRIEHMESFRNAVLASLRGFVS